MNIHQDSQASGPGSLTGQKVTTCVRLPLPLRQRVEKIAVTRMVNLSPVVIEAIGLGLEVMEARSS